MTEITKPTISLNVTLVNIFFFQEKMAEFLKNMAKFSKNRQFIPVVKKLFITFTNYAFYFNHLSGR
jgi:hypothetical protein